MIARHWKGIARREEAQNYIRYLESETFPGAAKLGGFVRASILTRDVAQGVEFVIISVWESEAAIRKFAGDVPTRAVVPPAVQAMMVKYEPDAIHYNLVEDWIAPNGK